MANASPPLVLLPGMMADERLFRGQRGAFPNLIVPPWPEWRASDSLADFATRLADSLHQLGPCVVGGVSFGGVVALELARHVPALGCVLISSIRSPRELPLRYRALAPAGRINQRTFNVFTLAGLRAFGPSMPAVVRRRGSRLASESGEFYLWATRALLGWRGARPIAPVLQIHGSQDRTFPLRSANADVILEGAGHILIQTHAGQVNRAMGEFIASVTPHPSA